MNPWKTVNSLDEAGVCLRSPRLLVWRILKQCSAKYCIERGDGTPSWYSDTGYGCAVLCKSCSFVSLGQLHSMERGSKARCFCRWRVGHFEMARNPKRKGKGLQSLTWWFNSIPRLHYSVRNDKTLHSKIQQRLLQPGARRLGLPTA
jgi:hypothetical protein